MMGGRFISGQDLRFLFRDDSQIENLDGLNANSARAFFTFADFVFNFVAFV